MPDYRKSLTPPGPPRSHGTHATGLAGIPLASGSPRSRGTHTSRSARDTRGPGLDGEPDHTPAPTWPPVCMGTRILARRGRRRRRLSFTNAGRGRGRPPYPGLARPASATRLQDRYRRPGRPRRTYPRDGAALRWGKQPAPACAGRTARVQAALRNSTAHPARAGHTPRTARLRDRSSYGRRAAAPCLADWRHAGVFACRQDISARMPHRRPSRLPVGTHCAAPARSPVLCTRRPAPQPAPATPGVPGCPAHARDPQSGDILQRDERRFTPACAGHSPRRALAQQRDTTSACATRICQKSIRSHGVTG